MAAGDYPLPRALAHSGSRQAKTAPRTTNETCPVKFGAVDALDDLPAKEALAVELATLAGQEIVAAFGTIFMVRYKPARDVVKALGYDHIETLSRAADRYDSPAGADTGRDAASTGGRLPRVAGGLNLHCLPYIRPSSAKMITITNIRPTIPPGP